MTDTNQKELTKNTDKSFILRLTIPAETVQNMYQKIKSQVAQSVEVKGFRKGKAPNEMIDEQISPEKLLEEVAQKLIPDIYQEKVKEYSLKPIIQPQIKIINPPISADKEWILEISGAELPEISIQDYQTDITALNQANKEKTKEARINEILDLLVKKSSVTLPQILLDAEVSYKLSRLIDQTNQAGITIQTYLKNQNTTLEQYKISLADQITKEWTLNLAIDKVAHDNKIEVTHEEVEVEEKKYQSQKIDHNFLHFIVLQNKTLEYLSSL